MEQMEESDRNQGLRANRLLAVGIWLTLTTTLLVVAVLLTLLIMALGNITQIAK